MSLPFFASWLIVMGTVAPTLTSASAAGRPDEELRALSLAVLRQALSTTDRSVRVNAAEALIEHQKPEGIAELFLVEADTTMPFVRIGVWRVLARAAETVEQRGEFVARIRTILHDAKSVDRLHAAESLAKLGGGTPGDIPILEAWLSEGDITSAAFLRWLMVQGHTTENRLAATTVLASMLRDRNVIARRRAAFGLLHLRAISPAARDLLVQAANAEPVDSPARLYILVAAVRHASSDGPAGDGWAGELREILPISESSVVRLIAPVLGRRGDRSLRSILERLLESNDTGIRVAAADGFLHLLR